MIEKARGKHDINLTRSLLVDGAWQSPVSGADYRLLNWNFECDRGGLLSNLQTESIIVINRMWVVLERTMRVKVIIRGLCDGDSRMLISQPLSLTTILFRTTIIRTRRLHNQLLISNLSLYWKENLQVCYYSVPSFLQNLFLQLSGSWHLRKHTN